MVYDMVWYDTRLMKYVVYGEYALLTSNYDEHCSLIALAVLNQAQVSSAKVNVFNVVIPLFCCCELFQCT